MPKHVYKKGTDKKLTEVGILPSSDEWKKKSDVGHKHTIADIANLQSKLDTIPSIKTLNTDNSSTLPVSSSEDRKGSGSIKLHKVSKTGKFSDLSNRGEEYLEWGGSSKAGYISPIGMALSAEHSANRVALINPNALTFEYSSDGGATWTAYSYAGTDKTKFCTSSLSLPIGRPNGGTNLVANKSKTRITITAQNGTTGYVYTSLKKMLMNVSSATTLSLLIEARTGTNYKNNGAWSSIGTYNLSGWSGWNDIPLDLRLGGDKSQTSQYWQMRLTITCTTVSSSYPRTGEALGIRLFGDNCWNAPSTLAQTGNIYTYDMEGNVKFPKKLYVNESKEVLATGQTNTFTGTQAFNSGKIYLGQGDNNAIDLGSDGRINSGNSTLVGFVSGTFTLGHSTYNTNIRGKATRPTYNGKDVALKSDIPVNYVTTNTEQTISAKKTFSVTPVLSAIKSKKVLGTDANGLIEAHTLGIGDITDLQTQLNNKQPSGAYAERQSAQTITGNWTFTGTTNFNGTTKVNGNEIASKGYVDGIFDSKLDASEATNFAKFTKYDNDTLKMTGARLYRTSTGDSADRSSMYGYSAQNTYGTTYTRFAGMATIGSSQVFIGYYQYTKADGSGGDYIGNITLSNGRLARINGSLSSVNELTDAYAVLSDLNNKANKTHTHAISDITNLQTSLNGKANKSDIPTNYVTTNTAQTITGTKTFNAPASASGEQATTTFKTSNGGQLIIGKEGPNSGTMLRFDQTAGTTRLQFRASATPGAMVWSQPEKGATLFFDLTNSAGVSTRTILDARSGTIARTSDIGNGTITIQKNGTKVDSFTTNQSSGKTINIPITKSDVGLGNADNTADKDKSVKHASSADDATNAFKLVSEDKTTEYDYTDIFSIYGRVSALERYTKVYYVDTNITTSNTHGTPINSKFESNAETISSDMSTQFNTYPTNQCIYADRVGDVTPNELKIGDIIVIDGYLSRYVSDKTTVSTHSSGQASVIRVKFTAINKQYLDRINGKANASHTHAISDITNLQSTLNGKQATLVSGTNIKTINGTSILGGGDIPVVASLAEKSLADIINATSSKSGYAVIDKLLIQWGVYIGAHGDTTNWEVTYPKSFYWYPAVILQTKDTNTGNQGIPYSNGAVITSYRNGESFTFQLRRSETCPVYWIAIGGLR